MPYSISLKNFKDEELETLKSVPPHIWKKMCEIITKIQEQELGSALNVESSAERTKQHLGRFEMARAVKDLPYQAANRLEDKRKAKHKEA